MYQNHLIINTIGSKYELHNLVEAIKNIHVITLLLSQNA